MSFSITEQMLYSATRITTYCAGNPLNHGTGFFYQVNREDGQSSLLLVTNRHVFDNCDRIDLSLHLDDGRGAPSGRSHRWRLNFQGNPIQHPDPMIDLAVISITELHHQTAYGNKEFPFYIPLHRAIIPTPEQWDTFDAIEEVTMVGCPNGLFDEVNNLPIFRRGITASHPSKNYQGKDEILVDIACFPGSSGSPVFLYSTGTNYDRNSGNFSLGQIRCFLLGILYSGPTISQAGEITLNQKPSVTTATMMHLGNVIKSTQLLAFDTLVQAVITNSENY